MNSRNDYSNSGYSPDVAGSGREYGPSSRAAYGSGSRERRPGGYGGFYESSPTRESEAARRARSVSRQRVRDDAQYGAQRSWYDENGRPSTARGNSSGGGGGGSQQVDDAIRRIQQEWDSVADEECTPVQIGLQLLDPSTLGQAEREPDFLRTHSDINETLKGIVNEHHQGFSGALGTYHRVQHNIHDSQHRLRSLKSVLGDSKSGLLTTNPELQGFATASQSYDDLLQFLGRIEHIQSLPETLELRISEKRFIAAVEVLTEARGLLNRPEFGQIGGLGDLRAYFTNQETTLTDILIEELHDHLYLKSPYCRDRWKAPAKATTNGHITPRAVPTWDKPVYRFLSALSPTSPLTDDASSNPEADTFAYIYLLVETLDRMGNMELMVDRIEQRLPVELNSVVDKTCAEVAARHPDPTRGLQKKAHTSNRPTNSTEERGYVLSEFLWDLYAKFEAIAEGHRVVHDVIAGISERQGNEKDTLKNGFRELWKLYQSEIRSLLHDYLATDGVSNFRASNNSKDQFSSAQRDKSKKLFKLSEVDQTSGDIKTEQADLDGILRSSVPGLVSKSRQKLSPDNMSRSNQENSGTGHKLLIEPNVFNISFLIPPALSFIQRLTELVPMNSDIGVNKLTTFLDDFMTHVFQPQLEEAVSELCVMCFIAPDAYMEDPQWHLHSTKPIFKGTVSFMNLIKRFSLILDSIPHDQAFTQLLLSQMVTYYEKCCGWYKALVSRMSPQNLGGIRLKAAAAYAELDNTRELAARIWDSPINERQDPIHKEIDTLINLTNETPLEPYDIVSDAKTVFSVSLLYNSMNWLVSSLLKLRHITPFKADSSRGHSRQLSGSRRWTLSTPRPDLASQPPRLPMTEDSVVGFDKTVDSFKSLGLTVLFTLHLDVRCGAIQMVTRSLKGTSGVQRSETTPTSPSPPSENNWTYILSAEPSTASPSILELNKDLISFDASISSHLGAKEHYFITSGLANFIDRAFVSGTRFIGAMNRNGAMKLQLDVLVLQQNLKNIIIPPPQPTTSAAPISPSPSEEKQLTSNSLFQETVALPKSAKFIDWFLEGPDKAVQLAKEEKEAFKRGDRQAIEAGNGEPFTYDELKVLVELCFSAVLKGPRGMESREDFLAAKRGSGDALLRLSEVMWDS